MIIELFHLKNLTHFAVHIADGEWILKGTWGGLHTDTETGLDPAQDPDLPNIVQCA